MKIAEKIEKHKPLIIAVAFVFLFFVFAWLVRGTIRGTSVTFDEFARIPLAAAYRQSGDLRIDPIGTMPLARRIIGAAYPFAGVSPTVQYGASWRAMEVWEFGTDFMRDNYEDYIKIVEISRIGPALCGALLCLLVFLWSYRIFGAAAGLVSLAVLCLDPNIIAHSSVAGIDIPLSLFVFASFFFWFLWMETCRVRYCFAAGACLGAAMLIKVTAIFFIPIFIVLIYFGKIWLCDNKKTFKKIAIAALALVILFCSSLVVFNTEYKWRGVGNPLSSYSFRSDQLMLMSSKKPGFLPVPLPADFVKELDLEMFYRTGGNAAGAEGQGVYYYLNGVKSSHGWPQYFLVAWALKEPFPVMIFFVLGLVAIISRKRFRELLPLLPGAAFVLALSFAFRMDMGFRFALPAVPFQALIAGASAGIRPARPFAALLIAWMLLSAVHIHPNHIAYFNELAGGPANGHKHLIDSNLDWGQSLPSLKKYLDKRGVEKVYLANYGFVDPEIYGLKYTEAPCAPAPGVFAVSVNFYYDILPMLRGGCFDFLKSSPPDDVAAYNYFIFEFR